MTENFRKKRRKTGTWLFVICMIINMSLQPALQILAAGNRAQEMIMEDNYSADQNSYGDYKYRILSSWRVEITGYSGTASNISIPSEIDGKEVVKIGENAFYGCNNLKSVTIPKGVYYIDAFAFSGCGKLESVIIPDTVLIINSGAFSECKSLSNITIPQGVKEIWCNAFDSCSSLQKIIIPDSVSFIGSNVFWGCSSLTSIEFKSDMVRFKGGVEFLFYGCSSLKSITLNNLDRFTEDGIVYKYDNGVKLSYCPGGRTGTLTIPENVKGIEKYAFEDCSKLKNIIILGRVETIADSTFKNCSNLKSIAIPKSVKKIERFAFWQDNRLKNVYYEGSLKQWKKISIDMGNENLTNANIHYKSNINAPTEASMLKSGRNTYKVTIMGSAVSFVKTSSTSSKITVPDSVTIDGVKYKVTSIADKAFAGNRKIKHVVIGNHVTSIGKNAFSDCKKLTNVTVGTKVEKIGKEAFKGCAKLGKITIKSTKLTNVGKNAFRGIKSTAKIKVPAKKLGRYKKLFKSKGQGRKVRII